MEQQPAVPATNVMGETSGTSTGFQPQIEALVCTYCTNTAADIAGSQRLQYPATVRIMKYPCTGRISIEHMLKAFENGADTVFVAGCEIGKCHFVEGNLRAQERVAYVKKLLDEIGLSADRLEMFHIGASDPHGFVRAVKVMTERASKLGANPLK